MNQYIPHDNATLRALLRQKRETQDPAERSRGALRIRARLYTWLATQQLHMQEQGRLEPLIVAGFWSLPEEPELQPLLAKWALEDNQLTVALPCIAAPQAPLVFKTWDPDTPMQDGPYQIAEPAAPATTVTPDIILVPTLGFTRAGDRLGYGQGYYDRTLAQLRARYHPFVTIGIAWSCGDLSQNDYKPQPHDQPLDSILTEMGWAKAAPAL